ncbi:hypothetical protein RQP46_005569 [Phenoliferia psychrophenolica]
MKPSVVTLAALTLPAVVLGQSAASPPPRTNEAQAAAILNPALSCAPYDYPPASALVKAYPTVWATADLSNPGIPAADRAVFTSITGVPNIAPKGTRAGDFSKVKYPASDPDCWWTFGKCTTPKIAAIPVDVTNCDEPDTYGFTLDDGPNCSHNAYYDYLKTIDQKATLFSALTLGKLKLHIRVGLNLFDSADMTALTNEHGDVDDRVRYIANALNLATIGWADDTFDWSYSTIGVPAVKQNYHNILDRQSNGTFSKRGTELDAGTMALSEEFLPQIREQFTGGVMPVGVCRNITKPYLEEAFVYPNYVQYAAGTRSVSLAAPTAITKNVPLKILAGGVRSSNAPGPTSAAGTVAVVGASSKSYSASYSTRTSTMPGNPSGVGKPVSSGGRTVAGSMVLVLAVVGLMSSIL